MTFQDTSEQVRPEQQTDPTGDPGALQWVDQFAQEMLLTAQAFRRLQTAIDARFLATDE